MQRISGTPWQPSPRFEKTKLPALSGHDAPSVKKRRRAPFVLVDLLVAAGSTAAYIYVSRIGNRNGAMTQSEIDTRVAADTQADASLAQAPARLASALANRSNSPDRALLAIVDLSDTWVVANLKETQLAEVKPGQPVDIEIDSYAGSLSGHVDSVAAGTGSRFSLLPPDNASGNFIKVTQRVPVKIKLDDRRGHLLRPGMSAEVTIHTRRCRVHCKVRRSRSRSS